MQQLPFYLPILFVITTTLAVFLFYYSTNGSRVSLYVLLTWLVVQMVISVTGFYDDTRQMPPRFLLVLAPPLLLIVILFVTRRGRAFLHHLDARKLTLLHVVRIPVELVLFALFINKAVPGLMTFEGRNFDILSGLTAPLVYYFGYVKKVLSDRIILAWNFVCLLLLFNIVVHAILSAPFPFQRFAFDQPNVAILHFPFVWLPACIVPLVLLAHLVCIRKLLMGSKGDSRNAALKAQDV